MKNAIYYDAGAGSGKTTTLTNFLSNRIINKRVTPANVIMTTFTINAANEFKGRVRENLLGDPITASTASEIEDGCFGTVDSVCEQFIRRYWNNLGISSQLNVLSDADKRAYISETLNNSVTPADLKRLDECAYILSLNDNDFWRGYVEDLITKMSYYGLYTHSDFADGLAESVDIISQIFNSPAIILTDVKNLCKRLYADISAVGGKSKKDQDSLNTINLISSKSDVNLRDIKDLAEIIENTPTKTTIKKYPSFPSYKIQCTPWLTSESFLPYMKDICRISYEIAEKWEGNYKQYKTKHHMIDFTDMEAYFLELLNNHEDVQTEIAEKYKLLMVDEFQDTNPLQQKIFDKLSDIIGVNGGETVLVGDVKQSIYGFRGADSDLVADIVCKFKSDPIRKSYAYAHDNIPSYANGAAPLKLELPTSYRSTKTLVDLAAKVFDHVYGTSVSLKPDRSDLSGKPDSVLHWQITTNTEESLAQRILDIFTKGPLWKVSVKGTKTERDIQYGDIAILCRTNAECDNFAYALRKCGLPVATPERNLLQRQEILLLIEMMRAVHSSVLDTKMSLYKLLCNKSSVDVINDFMSSHLSTVSLSRLHDFRELSVSDTARRLVDTLKLKDFVACWGEGEARSENLESFCAIAEEYEHHCALLQMPASLSGFIRYIQSITIDLPFDNTCNAVKILTYHGSKGLEWPVVILNDIDKFEDLEKKQLRAFFGVHYNKATGKVYLFPSFLPDKAVTPDPIKIRIKAAGYKPSGCYYNDICNKEISTYKNEMYVGFTRARDYLITIGVPRKDKSYGYSWLKTIGLNFTRSVTVSNKVDVWFQKEYSSLEILSAPVSCSAPGTCLAAPSAPLNTNIQYSPTPLSLSPSKLEEATGSVVNTLINKLKPNVLQSTSNPIIRTQKIDDHICLGDCIHHIFAALDINNLYSDSNSELVLRTIRNAGLESQFCISGKNDKDVAKSVLYSFNALLDYLKRQSNSQTSLWREMPFTYAPNATECKAMGIFDGQILHGNIDLVWFTGKKVNGKDEVILVDYKTFADDYTNASIKPTYVGKYAPQQYAYKCALTASGYSVKQSLIYYAILGHIVELENI